MFFKNAVFYRFTKPFAQLPDDVEAALKGHQFGPCASQELSRTGFSPVLKGDERLCYPHNGLLMLKLTTEAKILPAATVNNLLLEKIEQIESEQDRKVRKKERDDLKDEAILTLLPKAFSRFTHTFGYIDPVANILVIEASSAKRAEVFCSSLRQALGSLPVTTPAMNKAPASVMTEWLRDAGAPSGFGLGRDAVLKDPSENGATARLKNEELLGEEVRAHVEAGKQVIRVDLDWSDSVSFSLSDDLILRKLKFSDALLDQAADAGASDHVAAFEADFYLMSQTVAQLISTTMAVLGGENLDAYKSAFEQDEAKANAA